jgi:hypothetical protein
MSTSANNGIVSIGQLELLKQQLTKQISEQHAAVTDELSLIRQQLEQLIQPNNAANSTVAACECSTAVHHSSNAPALGSHQQLEHRHQRARVSDDQIPVLARNEVLDTVFSFVGIGEYYYVAGVCRNWRGKYMAFCHHTPAKWPKVIRQPYTSCSSIVTTAARLQLALDNGLTVDALNKCTWRLADNIASFSSEPIAVLTVARCYGLEWNAKLPLAAASSGKLGLLQWMHKCGCPIDVAEAAVESNKLAVVTWLYERFPTSFTAELKQNLLWRAGWMNRLPVVKWLREHDVEWPEAFCCNALSTFHVGGVINGCWSLQCVQWALAHGSTWRDWHCCQYHGVLYDCSCQDEVHDDGPDGYELCDVRQAATVFKWAHENGCPCTCDVNDTV